MEGANQAPSGFICDIIVVGAGIEGLATAYDSARNGYRTLLLEQFFLPHTRGSSHGQSRLIRQSYSQDFYVSMMQDVYRMWSDLEKEAQYPIFIRDVGCLTFGLKPNGVVDKVNSALAKAGVEFQRLNTEQLRMQFPMMSFDGDFDAIYEPTGGVLKADSILQVYQRLFKKYGGIVNDGEKVESIIPGDLVTVKTSRDTYKARSVVIATGPWFASLLKPLGIELPLRPERNRVCFWKQKTPKYSPAAGFPGVFMTQQDPDQVVSHNYAIPAIEYPHHVKVCLSSEIRIDPDARDEYAADTTDLDGITEFVRKFLPGLEDKPTIVETCITTEAPDGHYVIDTHPKWKNIVIGVGFSGHGFKLAPVIGKILCEMATGRELSYNITPFRMSRFSKSTAKPKL